MDKLSASKAEWGPGPWQDEPDRVLWRHAGLPCLVRRSPGGGNWCGYVGVPPGHPDHGRDHSAVDVLVHGGLTFGEPCDGDEENGICHVPEPGEPDAVWWLGFDCGHAFDLSPAMEARFAAVGFAADVSRSTYRDLAYVRAEAESLADQLVARSLAHNLATGAHS